MPAKQGSARLKVCCQIKMETLTDTIAIVSVIVGKGNKKVHKDIRRKTKNSEK
jgi:hypothetical protein